MPIKIETGCKSKEFKKSDVVKPVVRKGFGP